MIYLYLLANLMEAKFIKLDRDNYYELDVALKNLSYEK